MSAKISKQMVRNTFEHFVKYMGLPENDGTGKNPYAALDYYAPGGNKYMWQMVIVHPEQGFGQEDCFGYGRMTTEAIYEAMHFAMNVKQYQERERK